MLLGLGLLAYSTRGREQYISPTHHMNPLLTPTYPVLTPPAMTTATTHGAWCALAPASALEYQQVKAKTPDDDDVDVTVMYCGLCGSDATALLGETRALNPPRVCGHEIVGRIARIGPAVSGFQVGDMVGIGAQCDSCRECSFCLGGK